MAIWQDFMKLFSYINEKDPLSKKKDTRSLPSAGIGQPDVYPTLGAEGAAGGAGGMGGQAQLRQSYDMIDTTTLTNRSMRYKEYDRLRQMPEIEMVMTVIADEACIAGSTKIATPFGFQTIETLANQYTPEQRFLVYCWDFSKQDYVLGWAYHPRLVKKAPTITIICDDGSKFTMTEDHRVLTINNQWIQAKDIKFGTELKPFYRIPASYRHTKALTKQFPRVYTISKGWINERQFIDEWKNGKDEEKYKKANTIMKMICNGLSKQQIIESYQNYRHILEEEGFSFSETKQLAKRKLIRRVVGKYIDKEMNVYDLSVEEHKNFATDGLIMHNCQKDDDGNCFKVFCANDQVKKEVEFLLQHRKMLNMNHNCWNWFKNLCAMGDHFLEIVINPDNPKEGIYKVVSLPPDSMYRIETTKGKLIEFQQSKEGPDYQALVRAPMVSKATDTDLNQSQAIRFDAHQIIHMKIGDDRKNFYPYGQSLIEAARSPAHMLRLLEDAMITMRLCLAGDSRIRTKDSYKLLKDIKIDDIVYSYTPDNEIVETKVTDFMDNGYKDILCVRSRHIEIKGTKDHPILVNRQGKIQYVELQNLEIKNDRLILTTNNNAEENIPIPFLYTEPWARLSLEQKAILKTKKYHRSKRSMLKMMPNPDVADAFLYNKKNHGLPLKDAELFCELFELDKSKLIIANKGQNNIERINVPKFVDEEFARLFGFLCADGSISNNHCTLEFTSINDIEKKPLDTKNGWFYRDIFKKYFGEVNFDLDKRSKKVKYGKYRVCSKFACELFLQMGYINNHNINRIPQWVYNAPKNIRRAFIEGFSDGDGTERYTKAGTWFSTIELSNEEMIRDIKEIWMSVGLSAGHLSSRYRNHGSRKLGNHEMPTTTTTYIVTISDCQLDKEENVISIKPYGKEKVYDITVESKNHNFIINSTIAHNCRSPERRIFYIDVGQLPPFKAEAFVERMKDQFRKRKVSQNRFNPGANQVEEKYQPPAFDEDLWMPIRPNSQSRIETLPGACLSLDTKIPLLDGRILTLSELISEYESGKVNWAYSCNPETGSPAPGKISWAGITRKNTDVVKITFDNGEHIICTPDHKFPIIGKGKIEAKDLKIGESMIPWNTRLEELNQGKTKYLQVYNFENKEWKFVHRMVCKLVNGFNLSAITKMLKYYGYSRIKHAKKDVQNYNHRIISIEYLEEKIDTGTLTIDANHEIHNYHTFALNIGVYTCNSGMSEIDDVKMFRQKLFIALNFPPNYYANEDIGATRITLSSQDVKFAKMIERLQSHFEDGLLELAERHLELKGYPDETYEDLKIKMTPPSDWRELSRAEVVNGRYSAASTLKSSQLMSDRDIMIKILKITEDEVDEMLSRLKIQKLEDLKLQIIAQNPAIIGVGIPGQENQQQEMGTEPGGPSTNPMPPQENQPEEEQPQNNQPNLPQEQPKEEIPIPDATNAEIKKYDLEIQDYETDQDQEPQDFSIEN